MNYRRAVEELLSSLKDRRKELHLYRRNWTWRLPPVFFTPPKSCKVIEIVGSKWKTSTAYYLAGYLSRAGKKVGLFTSPHLIRVNERLQIWQAGKPVQITDKELYLILLSVLQRAQREKLSLSYFEALFISAVKWFSQNLCDFIVQEAGLGGRYDATNSIPNDYVVITRIELEHTHILGNSYEDILREKAAVVKKHTKQVFVYPSLRRETYRKLVPHAEKIKFIPSRGPLAFAQKVASIILNVPMSFEITLQVPGRREVLADNEFWQVIVDIAHTPASFRDLIAWLPKRDWNLFFSIAKDKQIGDIIKIIRSSEKIVRIFYVDLPREERILSGQMFIQQTKALGLPMYIVSLHQAKGLLMDDGCHMVAGSHYLVGEVKRFFPNKVRKK